MKKHAAAAEIAKVGVNEEKLDLLLEMMKGADVTSEENEAENQTLLELEGMWVGGGRVEREKEENKAEEGEGVRGRG